MIKADALVSAGSTRRVRTAQSICFIVDTPLFKQLPSKIAYIGQKPTYYKDRSHKGKEIEGR